MFLCGLPVVVAPTARRHVRSTGRVAAGPVARPCSAPGRVGTCAACAVPCAREKTRRYGARWAMGRTFPSGTCEGCALRCALGACRRRRRARRAAMGACFLLVSCWVCGWRSPSPARRRALEGAPHYRRTIVAVSVQSRSRHAAIARCSWPPVCRGLRGGAARSPNHNFREPTAIAAQPRNILAARAPRFVTARRPRASVAPPLVSKSHSFETVPGESQNSSAYSVRGARERIVMSLCAVCRLECRSATIHCFIFCARHSAIGCVDHRRGKRIYRRQRQQPAQLAALFALWTIRFRCGCRPLSFLAAIRRSHFSLVFGCRPLRRICWLPMRPHAPPILRVPSACYKPQAALRAVIARCQRASDYARRCAWRPGIVRSNPRHPGALREGGRAGCGFQQSHSLHGTTPGISDTIVRNIDWRLWVRATALTHCVLTPTGSPRNPSLSASSADWLRPGGGAGWVGGGGGGRAAAAAAARMGT